MPPTVSIEAHKLRTRTGEWCDTCLTWSTTSVDVALVDTGSLRVLARFTGSGCTTCGTTDVVR